MLPSWIDEDLSNRVMCLSDDADSLVACALLTRAKGLTVNYFFDFNNLYVLDKDGSRRAIGVDIALTSGRCFDNHVTLVTETGHLNPQSANLNSVLKINSRNYTEKYAMSTAILVYSLYFGSGESCAPCGSAAPDPHKTRLSLDLTEEGRMLLLAIDSGYLGHFRPEFKNTHRRYMTILGIPGMTDTLDSHKAEDFAALSQEYNLGGKIWVGAEGKLTTDMDLEGIGLALGLDLTLPQSPAHLLRSGKRYAIDVSRVASLDPNGIVSMALTRRNTAQYTRLAA